MLIGVFGIIQKTFALYFRNAKHIFAYLGLLFIPPVALKTLQGVLLAVFGGTQNGFIIQVISWGYVLLQIVTLVISFWILIALVRSLANMYRSGTAEPLHVELHDARALVIPGLSTTLAVLASMLVWFVPFLAYTVFQYGSGILLAPRYLIGLSLYNPALAPWFILSLIPAIYVGMWLILSLFVVMVEGEKKTGNALKASIALVRGRWWGVFWRVLIPWAVFYYVAAVVIDLMYSLVLIIGSYAPTETNSLLSLLVVLAFIYIIIFTGLLFVPLDVGAKLVLYEELKKVPPKHKE